MKTIEERAIEYSPDPWDENCTLPAREGHIINRQRQAYIAGAKDQQYIDRLLIKHLINKAWSLAYSMYQVGRDNLTPLTKDEFCKKNGGMDGLDHDITDAVLVDEIEDFVKP